MRDGVVPGKRSVSDIFDRSSSAGSLTVSAWIMHRQPIVMGLQKIICQRLSTVVSLQNECAVALAELYCGVNTRGNSGAFEYDIGSPLGKVPNGFCAVGFAAVYQVICAKFLSDLQAVFLEIDCDDLAATMAASRDDPQADEPTAEDGYGVTHSRVGHVYAVEANSWHDEQTRGFLVNSFRQVVNISLRPICI